MANGKAYQYATQQIVDYARKIGAEMIVGPEARWIYRWMSCSVRIRNWFCASS